MQTATDHAMPITGLCVQRKHGVAVGLVAISGSQLGDFIFHVPTQPPPAQDEYFQLQYIIPPADALPIPILPALP